MRYKTIILSVFVFFILNPFAFTPSSKTNSVPYPGPGLYAQEVDLVKLKKEEEERKKKTKKSKYVVTNESLDKIELPKKPYGYIKLGKKEEKEAGATAGGETGSQVETEVTTNAGVNAQAVDAGGGPEHKEYWQDRVRKIYADMDKTEAEIKNSQWEFNQVNNMLQAEDIYEKRLELQKRLDELTKIIPELKQQLNDLNKALEDLEDQARKQGVPAGWLRVDRPEPNPEQQKTGQSNKSTKKEKG